ncbi:MAG TPA: hypothetical protein VKP12_11390 [Kiloniellaceae bacterium]|nr:hypothetical protein [Kiloniellaceae bacterium]
MAASTSPLGPCLAAVALVCGFTAGGAAAAQDAAYFTPTYAASRGSPYSEVYARTFGAAPLETAAPPAASDAGAVYVIEDGRLLTYSAEDYARGGPASAGAALPGGAADGRLYGAIPRQPDLTPPLPPRKPY